MRRAVAMVVLASVVLLGTGGAQYIHSQHHLEVDAEHSDAGGHDESSCVLHMQLRSPLILESTVPLLILAGLFVAFLTLLPQQRVVQIVRTRISCRGPPALAMSSTA